MPPFSAGYDLYDKKRAYRRNQIQEYLVWQIFENKLDWFSLQNDEYISLVADEEGIIRSLVYPGLWLGVSALLEGNIPKAMTILQAGLQSSEQRQFIGQMSYD